jgi:hypothetical protein
MRRSNFPLRLVPSLLEEARKVAEDEGVALNQLINIAVAEKISVLRTEAFFRQRARRANVQEALDILDSAGDEPTRPGDELVEDVKPIAVNEGIDHIIRNAIRTKHLMRFRYKGRQRIAEPHDYGIQNGIVRLFCYQVGGQSRNRIPGWRLIDVAAMQDCEILEKTFAGNREVSGKHHRWDEVFIRVGPALVS